MELPFEKLASMSLKGTQLARPETPGLHFVFRPVAAKSANASGTHGASAPPANDGLSPEGRKKLTIAAGTKNGRLDPGTGFAPQGTAPVPTDNGLSVGKFAPAATAACQFSVSRSPRAVLALMGRFRRRPPFQLYARLNAKPPPKSRSTVRFACCE